MQLARVVEFRRYAQRDNVVSIHRRCAVFKLQFDDQGADDHFQRALVLRPVAIERLVWGIGAPFLLVNLADGFCGKETGFKGLPGDAEVRRRAQLWVVSAGQAVSPVAKKGGEAEGVRGGNHCLSNKARGNAINQNQRRCRDRRDGLGRTVRVQT
jgi:hypothetical protein